MKLVPITLACALLTPPCDAQDSQVLDFEDMPLGRAPHGMSAAQTHDAPAGHWQITADERAPSGRRVLTQTDAADVGRRYPLCILDGPVRTDASVQVAFKTMTGRHDRAAGLCVRYLDADNYYCARVNSLEDNYRLYRVVDGVRSEIAGVDHLPILEDVWQTMRIEVCGARFRLWLNGAPVFEAEDATFQDPGRVGLWLKGDSITSFDDLVVSVPGPRWRSDFGSEPIGPLAVDSLRSVTASLTGWSVVADGPPPPTGHHAVTAVDAATGTPGRTGAVLLVEDLLATDLSIATRFRVGTEGPHNHVAALLVRYRDPDNHHLVRFNPQESNIRLYRVRDGQRALVGEVHHTRHQESAWHRARVTATGPQFEVLVDGELQFRCRDDEVPACAGLAGLWAVCGDGTRYAELQLDRFR